MQALTSRHSLRPRHNPWHASNIGAAPCTKLRPVRQRAWPAASSRRHAAAAEASYVLLMGFASEEVQHLQTHIAPSLFGKKSAGAAGPSFYAVTSCMLDTPVHKLQPQGASSSGHAVTDDVQLGRIAFFVGDCQQHAASMNDVLLDAGMLPAIIAARQPRHEKLLLRQVLQSVRQAHAQYHELHQPLKVHHTAGALPSSDARLVMNLVLDKGSITDTTGAVRVDQSHVVVLDGLCTEGERANMLEWLTAGDHDHSGPPPDHKWQRVCVDRAGDRATWGLQEELLQALQDDPPAGLLALQSRVAALYPEFQICHMPAHALGDDEGDGDDDAAFSSFVANAVMYGDPCGWHVDADPSRVPIDSPWVTQHQIYVNRQPHKPLFVSLLLYLNDAWPNDQHAETLFLDPASGTGAFVQPWPGRVVLADQDVPHRINAPSMDAAGPRYSLVLKLVFLPRSSSSSDHGSAATSVHASTLHTLARPEWGTPQQLGSASALGTTGLLIPPPATAAAGAL